MHALEVNWQNLSTSATAYLQIFPAYIIVAMQ